jgi:hypothetical protein
LANSSKPTFARMIFCSLVIIGVLFKTPRPGATPGTSPLDHSGQIEKHEA